MTAERDLPVVVGAAARRLPGDRGDQLVYGDDGTLTLWAGSPIEGLVVSQHRPTVLVVEGKRWALVAHHREGGRDVYTLRPFAPGPFEREGAVIDYDADRVHHARIERLSVLVRAIVTIAALPLLPIVGLLPEATKERLRARGLYPTTENGPSLVFEWMLLLVVVAAEWLSILAEAGVVAALLAAVGLAILVDIPHRIVMAAEGRDVGMFSWARALRDQARRPNEERDDDRAAP